MSCILIAEDDPHILRVISLWLSRQGHEVLEARNGVAALERFNESAPEILITDVNMPGMDGLELLKRVGPVSDRSTGEGPGLRGVVVLTNRWDHGEIGERLSASGVHVMPKPFSPTRLAELIDELLAREASQSPP